MIVVMPPSVPITDLRKLAPSQEEVLAARKIIQASSEKELKSKMNSFGAWLKKQDDVDPDIVTSRGEKRKEWLELFLAHQMKSKGAQKQAMVEKTVARKKQEYVDHHWWSQETMDKEMGPMKGAAWRSSGSFEWKPCPLTKSTEPHMIVYAVPVAWKRLTDEDVTAMKVNLQSEATQQDLQAIDDMFMDGGDTSGGCEPEVKTEVLTDAEKAAAEAAEFLGSLTDKVMMISAYELEMKEMISKRLSLPEAELKCAQILAGDDLVDGLLHVHNQIPVRKVGRIRRSRIRQPD